MTPKEDARARRDDGLLAGEYFLAVQGLAMIRTCLTDPSSIRARADDIRGIVASFDEFPYSLEIPMTELSVDDGYSRWAPLYDGPNPAIQLEQPIVDPLLAALTPGDALDAACGTGRHAETLAELGHRVIGVDGNRSMLEIARAKVPTGSFRLGRLENLPVEDSSVDVLTCALALTHVPALAPVISEFGRVVRPGGTVVLSDIHPFVNMTAGIAGIPGGELTSGVPFVRNLVHQVSDYVTAFASAGLEITRCIEPEITEDAIAMLPSFGLYPEATRQAFRGTPNLLIWQLVRRQ